MVIQPGYKYELFHYTMVRFDHILSGVQISTIADFSSMHSAQRFFGCWLTFESSIVDMQYNIGVIW